jgi:uncharacterized protein (DUF736 family)
VVVGIVEKNGNSVKLKMAIPFHQNEEFLIVPARDKKDENSPDFVVLNRFGPVGKIWEKEAKDSGEKYKSGYIETPFGNVNIALFRPKEEDVKYLYKVVWTSEKVKKSESQAAEISEETPPDFVF